MKISYAITVCTELEEIKQLLPFLLKNKRKEDEVVVLFDLTNGSEEVKKYLLQTSEVYAVFDWFQNNFSEWKNKLNTLSDKGLNNSTILELTKKINGGTNGLTDRIKYTNTFAKLFGIT